MLVNQSIISDLKAIIAHSNDRAVRAVDHQRTLMYWHIGKRIFEEEQQSKDRADYGGFLIKIPFGTVTARIWKWLFPSVRLISIVNFTVLSQLCTHWMHN